MWKRFLLSLSLGGSVVIQMAERKILDCFKCVAALWCQEFDVSPGAQQGTAPSLC